MSYQFNVLKFALVLGISYFLFKSITMTRCVTYIQDPDTTVAFDINLEFIGSMYDFLMGPQLYHL